MLSRRHLLRFFSAGAVASVLLSAGGAAAFAVNNAGEFVIALKDDAIRQLGNATDEAEKDARFRKLLNDNFEVSEIGKFVVGRYWRRASEEERKAFLAVFEDVLVQRFLPLFDVYADQRFQVNSVRADSNRPEFSTVVSTMSQPEGADAQVLWRIRETNGKFVISDVKAEGISLRITYQSEYQSFLKNNSGDVDKLTRLLVRKVKAGAFAPRSAAAN